MLGADPEEGRSFADEFLAECTGLISVGVEDLLSKRFAPHPSRRAGAGFCVPD